MFQDSSDFTITGGAFTKVERDQYIHIQPGGRLVQYIVGKTTRDVEKPISSTWFRPLPISRGKIQIRDTLCDSAIVTSDWDIVGYTKRLNRLARCKVNFVTIENKNGHGESGSDTEEFLHIEYSGPGALNAYEEDFKQFSRNRTPHSVQLYGFSYHHEKPSLIFHEAPIPVSYILESHQYSPLLRTYIEYLYGSSKIDQFGISFSRLWINPRTGEIEKGPFVELRISSKVDYFAYGFESEALLPPGTANTPLPISTYNDPNALSRYLVEALPFQTILKGIRYSNQSYHEHDPKVEDLISTLSSLPGTIYHRLERKIILRFPPTAHRTKWTYGVWRGRTTMTRTKEVVDGNSVRIAFTLSEIQNLGRETELNRFEIYYKLQPVQEWRRFIYAWLVQADHSFSRLGIQDDCRDYAFLNGFWLCLERKPILKHPGGRLSRLKPASTIIYLIIRPIPSPFDETQSWSNWASGAKYSWSFDEFGGKELPEEMCDSLGLCSFTTGIVLDHTWWDRNGYDEIQMFYHSEGIEFPSTHLATLLGYPIFQIADSDRAEKADSEADSDVAPLNIDPNQSQQGTSPFQTRFQWLRMRRLGFPYYMRIALPEEWDID